MKVFVSILLLCFVFCLSCQQTPVRNPADNPEKSDGLSLYHAYYDPICKFGYSEDVSDKQVAVIAEQMALRDHRIWHYFWHSTRNSWHELTDEQKQFFLAFDPRWKPERLLGEPAGAQILNHDLFDPRKNDAGEDFLFMHHQMVTELFQTFAQKGLPCISPWQSLPTPQDKNWPVIGSKEAPKDDESYKKMEAWRKNFTSAGYLTPKSLGEVGYNLEISLHNNMHMRWATDNPPRGFGDRPEITPDNLKDKLKKYDDPRYNWLADPYSAHVNKTFWKLHGLVETVLFHWLASHQFKSVDANCRGDKCYQWKGTWVGAAPSHAVKSPIAVGDGHDHGAPRAAGGAPSSFEQSFADAFDQFVNGSPRSKSPGGPVTAPPPRSEKEKKRRRAVILEALRKLNQKAPMNRGALSPAALKETSSPIYEDPEEYVRWVEKKESSGH